MDFLFVYFVSQYIHALSHPYMEVDFFLEIFLWRHVSVRFLFVFLDAVLLTHLWLMHPRTHVH